LSNLDKEVYKAVKEEADRVSSIMSALILGRISASDAEKQLGVNYSSFSRKKLDKSTWVNSRVVAPLQNTVVFNQELLSNLKDTTFGSFCRLVFGSEVTELSEDFFTTFLPFVDTVVKSVDETEQRWFEKFFKGSTWLTAENTGDFLVAISNTQRVSPTRQPFVEKSIANIIKNVSKSWYVDRGLIFRYLEYPEVTERLLREGQVLVDTEGVAIYRPQKKGSRIEPCLTVDLFNSKIRALLNSKGFTFISDLESVTKIGLQSFAGLGISSFWKIEDVVEGLGYQFKVVEV
jgi:hypothetical protein